MENEQQENFQDLLESSLGKLDTSYQPGDNVTGTIISADDEYVYIDIGAKQEALASRNEFSQEDITSRTTVDALVDSESGSGIHVTCFVGKGFVSPQLLSQCRQSQQTVFGRIESEKTAGYDIRIGEIRAFCPKSQLSQDDIEQSKKNNGFIPFLIIEYAKNNCVVSSRARKELKQAAITDKLKGSLSEGDIFSGRVIRSEPFGIFIRLENGLEGLVPKSELSLSRLVSPDSFSPDDQVTVRILTLDWEKSKHAFSIRQTMPDPWSDGSIDSLYAGFSGSGTVCGMIKEGAFIELKPGVEGFVHISRLSKIKRVHKVHDILTIGQPVDYTIDTMDISRKRLSLILDTDEKDPWSDSDAMINRKHTVTIEKKIPAGLIVRLANGLDALVPAREIDDELSSIREGSSIEIVLTSANKEQRRASGSQKQVHLHEENSAIDSFIKEQVDSSDTATASLGSMFENVFSQMKERVDKNDKT